MVDTRKWMGCSAGLIIDFVCCGVVSRQRPSALLCCKNKTRCCDASRLPSSARTSDEYVPASTTVHAMPPDPGCRSCCASPPPSPQQELIAAKARLEAQLE